MKRTDTVKESSYYLHLLISFTFHQTCPQLCWVSLLLIYVTAVHLSPWCETLVLLFSKSIRNRSQAECDNHALKVVLVYVEKIPSEHQCETSQNSLGQDVIIVELWQERHGFCCWCRTKTFFVCAYNLLYLHNNSLVTCTNQAPRVCLCLVQEATKLVYSFAR